MKRKSEQNSGARWGAKISRERCLATCTNDLATSGDNISLMSQRRFVSDGNCTCCFVAGTDPGFWLRGLQEQESDVWPWEPLHIKRQIQLMAMFPSILGIMQHQCWVCTNPLLLPMDDIGNSTLGLCNGNSTPMLTRYVNGPWGALPPVSFLADLLHVSERQENPGLCSRNPHRKSYQ